MDSMCIGQHISIVGPSGTLRDGKVVEQVGDRVKVHYQGFEDAFDEWILLASDRIKINEEGNMEETKVEREIKICLRDFIGKEHHLEMSSFSEVLELKTTVSQLWTIPPMFQRLLVGETILENEQALGDYIGHSDLPDVFLVMVLVCADAVNAALNKMKNGCPDKEALEVLNNLGTLGQRTGPEVVKTIAPFVGDRRNSIRQAAIKALAKIARRGDRDALENLSEALKDPKIRDAMVTALKMIVEVGDEDTMFVMMSYLQSHRERALEGDLETVVEFDTQAEFDFNREHKIRQALGKAGYDTGRIEEYTFNASLLKWKRYHEYYQEIQWEGKWHIRGSMLDRMRWGFDRSNFPLTLILNFMHENNVEVCLAALDVLGHVAGKGNQMAIAAVAACLEDESDDVQWKAVEQLGLVIAAGDHNSIMHAKKRLTHPDRRVRWAAQEALGQFLEKSY